MIGSLNNILVYHAGGRLVLDEPFREQPSAVTITIQALDGRSLTELGSGFAAISDVAAVASTLSLTLPATTLRQRTIAPSATAGFVVDVDALTDPGYKLLINRGGRLQHVCPAEYQVTGSDITAFKLDDGLDYMLTAGDTAKGIRVQYDVDWSAMDSTDSKFVGQVLATWKVTVGGKVHVIRRVYDVVRQVLHCPASWQDVKTRRSDVDQQTSNLANKEAAVQQAWEDLTEEMRQRGTLFNLVVPDGSLSLRNAVVWRCLANLAAAQTISTPDEWNGLSEYLDYLEEQKSQALGNLLLIADENEDGVVSENEFKEDRGPVMLRGRRRKPLQLNKVSPS